MTVDVPLAGIQRALLMLLLTLQHVVSAKDFIGIFIAMLMAESAVQRPNTVFVNACLFIVLLLGFSYLRNPFGVCALFVHQVVMLWVSPVTSTIAAFFLLVMSFLLSMEAIAAMLVFWVLVFALLPFRLDEAQEEAPVDNELDAIKV